MPAHDGNEHADNEGLTPGQRRKLSLEVAGKRAASAETGAWTELLRMCVRGLLTRVVDARGDGTHTLQQSTTPKADTMRASDKMDSCHTRAALQILQTSARAPQNLQTSAEVPSLVAFETDEHEIARMRMQCAAIKLAAARFTHPPAKLVKRMARSMLATELDHLCYASGWATGLRQCSHTARRSYRRRPRLPHLIVVPRNQNQGSICHSHAHESFAQLRWRRCL